MNDARPEIPFTPGYPDHNAILSEEIENAIVVGCSCGWESEPYRSDKTTLVQYLEHMLTETTPIWQSKRPPMGDRPTSIRNPTANPKRKRIVP